MTTPIKIAIVEDHAGFREGLVQLLTAAEGYEVVGVYSSAEKSLSNLPPCDVILLDINLPGKSGIESIPFLKAASPAAQIIMLTGLDDDENIFAAILAGADGYLLKRTPPAKVLSAIDDAVAGGVPMTASVARRVVDHFKQQSPKQQEYQLSDREKEILSVLVQGFDNRAIAEKLFISYETVRNHLKNIYQKLHVNSRSQAVSKALTERIIP